MHLSGVEMSEHPDLDELQATYNAAVEAWISAIKNEEALASVNHTVAEVTNGSGRISKRTKCAAR